MRIALVNSAHAPHLAHPEALVEACATLDGAARALAGAGDEVRVFQAFPRAASFERGGVAWELVPSFASSRARRWRLPWALNAQVAAWAPEVVHLNSLLFARQAADLRRRLPRAALLVQHHAERPPATLLGRRAARGLAACDAFLFSGAEVAGEWRDAGWIGPGQPVFEAVEGSTGFTPGDRAAARERSGVDGEPALLWVGRLDANKDPETVLSAVAGALARLPRLRLHLVFRGGDRAGAVRRALARSPALQRAVSLRGGLPHAAVEAACRAADLFVLGSRREGSGYAAIEAMACGAVPLLTDIPAFRFLTDGGRAGALWRPGDAMDLTRVLLEAAASPLDPRRARVRARFEERLSFAALARDLHAAYSTTLAARTP